MAPEIMNEIFQLREKSHYNLRYTSEFIIPPIHSVYHGRESASYLGPKLWELIPTVIRQIDTLSGFKKAIKKWKSTNCPCRTGKTYIPSHFLVFLLRHINPSMLVVAEGHTCSSKSAAFSCVFFLA